MKIQVPDSEIKKLNAPNLQFMLLPVSKTIKPPANAITMRFVNGAIKKKRKKKLAGTCVIRMGGLGDMVMLTSTLKKLKLKSPEVPLTLATLPEHKKIFESISSIDRCITVFELDDYRFDKVIDLRFAAEPQNIGPGSLPWFDYVGKDRSDVFDKLCSVNSSRKYFEIPVPIVDKCCQLPENKTIIGINATSSSPIRVIPPEYIKPLAKKIVSRFNATVVLFGKTEDWNNHLTQIKSAGIVNLLDKTSGRQVIDLCNQMDVIIAPDSGIAHIAGALRKKCLAIFGNIDPRTRVSYYPTVKALFPKGQLPCIPCFDAVGNVCLKPGTYGAACMRIYTPDKIIEEMRELL